MTDDAPARPDIPDELGGNPLTDEDVRRAEHPSEFEQEAGDGNDGEPAAAAPVTPAAGTGTPVTTTLTASPITTTLGVTVSPEPAPAAAEEPTQEPTEASTPESAENASPPVDATREEELGILDRLEADAKALRAKLFGPGQL